MASAIVSVLEALVIAPSPIAAFFTYLVYGDLSGTLLAYGLCIGLGIPAYVLLLWKRWLRWWHYLVAGLAASTAAAIVWFAYLFANSSNTRSLQYLALSAAGTALVASLSGSLVALLSWLFVRQGSTVLAAVIRGENAT
jgi:hypothetical protein